MSDSQLGLLVFFFICSAIGMVAWIARHKIDAWEPRDEDDFQANHKYLYAFTTYPLRYFSKKNVLKRNLSIYALIYLIISSIVAIAFAVSFFV